MTIKKIVIKYSPSLDVIKSLSHQTTGSIPENCHVSFIKSLLTDTKVDPSVENNYAIRWASRFGHADVVKLLLSDPRVDPSADNNYAIRCAYREHHNEVLKLLLADSRVGFKIKIHVSP